MFIFFDSLEVYIQSHVFFKLSKMFNFKTHLNITHWSYTMCNTLFRRHFCIVAYFKTQEVKYDPDTVPLPRGALKKFVDIYVE